MLLLSKMYSTCVVHVYGGRKTTRMSNNNEFEGIR